MFGYTVWITLSLCSSPSIVKDATAIQFLIKSYPKYIAIRELPLKSDFNKVRSNNGISVQCLPL